MNCPDGLSNKIVKNGFLSNGKQRYKCSCCGRQCVLNPKKRPISDETRTFIDKWLFERLSLAGVARATGVSKRWLQYDINDKYDHISKTIEVKKKAKAV